MAQTHGTAIQRIEQLHQRLLLAADARFYGRFVVRLEKGTIVHIERVESLAPYVLPDEGRAKGA